MIIPSSPDPVREPKAYQDMLVGLVGDDDPAGLGRPRHRFRGP